MLIVFFCQIIELPAVFFLGLWFLSNLCSGSWTRVARADTAGVAWWAHIGGFVVGLVWVSPCVGGISPVGSGAIPALMTIGNDGERHEKSMMTLYEELSPVRFTIQRDKKFLC